MGGVFVGGGGVVCCHGWMSLCEGTYVSLCVDALIDSVFLFIQDGIVKDNYVVGITPARIRVHGCTP